MPLILLIAAPLVAAPYQELRSAAVAEQRLTPGDTAVLVGLAEELGCVASHDPMDCEAMRIEPSADETLVELVPVDAMVLPALGDSPASILLPRYPYGLGEPVTPLLGPQHIDSPEASWVRVALPEGTDARFGQGQASLLVTPSVVEATVQPFVEPPGAPTVDTLISGVQADAWPPQLMPYTRTQVLLPMLPVAIRIQDGRGVMVELAFPEGPPPVTGQALVESTWQPGARAGMAAATGLCMRAYYAESLRRPSRSVPVMPSELTPPRLAVFTDEHGQIMDAVPLDPPWDQPEPASCLRANARLLPPANAGAALAVLTLSPQAAVAQPPTDPAPSSD